MRHYIKALLCKERLKTTIGNQASDIFLKRERIITPDMIGHNVSSQSVKGFISPIWSKEEFLGVDKMPEPKVFQVDANEMSSIQ